MKKLIIAVVALIVLIGALVWIKKHQNPNVNPTPAPALLTKEDTQVLNEAWGVFAEYLTALKAHDLPSVTSLSYQLSDTCKDPKQLKDCYAKMDSVSSVVGVFKQTDFTHIAYDAKQIIIYTDWHTEKTDLAYGYARNIIYFVRKADGTPQVLSMSLPEEIVYTLIAKGDTDATLQKELAPRLVDTDGDTLENEVENCTYPNAPKTCVKTDPTKKDSLGDGWWDSIRPLFYAPPAK
jgi:hypothetical protein